MKTLKEEIGKWLICFVVIWFIISGIIFAFRHSWMTDVERFLYLPEALMFQTVTVDEVRNDKK